MKTMKKIIFLIIYFGFGNIISYNEWAGWALHGYRNRCRYLYSDPMSCGKSSDCKSDFTIGEDRTDCAQICDKRAVIGTKCSENRLWCFCQTNPKKITNKLDYTIDIFLDSCSNKKYTLPKNASINIETIENGQPCPIESITFRGVWLCQFKLLWNNIPDNFEINDIQKFNQVIPGYEHGVPGGFYLNQVVCPIKISIPRR